MFTQIGWGRITWPRCITSLFFSVRFSASEVEAQQHGRPGHDEQQGGNSIDPGQFWATFGADIQAIFCPIELGTDLQ